jgi:Domain of unknown function (DUF4340)
VTTRGTLLLLAVLAVLAGYLWLVELRPAAEPAADATPAPLLAAAPAEVARLELDDGGRALAARQGSAGWVGPDDRPCPVAAGLVETLARLGPVMLVDARPANLADYGLAPPAAHLRLLGAGNRPLLDLEIGERNPAWTGFYARRAGEQAVVLVGSEVRWELDKLRNVLSTPES